MTRELEKKLREGVVKFTYRKKDGEARKAVGTLLKSMCPPIQGNGRPTPAHLQLYFDVEKGQWRSFIKESLIEITE